jgi:hypothetical protein
MLNWFRKTHRLLSMLTVNRAEESSRPDSSVKNYELGGEDRAGWDQAWSRHQCKWSQDVRPEL